MELERIMAALRRAHAAGDTAAATRLAAMARAASEAQPTDLSAQGGNLYSPQNAGMFTGEPSPAGGDINAMTSQAMQGVGQDVLPGGQSAIAAMHGYTYGSIDEMAQAALDVAFPNRNPDGGLARDMRSGIDQFRADEPLAAYSAEIGGTMLNPATWVGGAAGSLGKRVLANGAISGLLSGIYGFNTGEGGFSERMANAIPNAGLGAGIGAAIPVVGAGLQRGVNGLLESRAVRAAAKAAPSMDDLRAMAQSLYSQADAAAPMSRGPLGPVVQSTLDDATRLGLDPMLTPTASRVADNMTDAATSAAPDIGYRELDILRRQAAIPAGDIANRPQAAMGTRMIEGIDEFIAQSDPNLSETVVAARDMWSRLRKSEVIEQAIERARNQASGFENGIRTQFRAILNNPRRLRGFATEEVNAIRAVVRGTPMGNAMRLVGKLGLDLGANTNALGATIGAVTGGALGGPIGAVALPAIASVMRAGANRTTQAAANRVQGLLTSGGVSNVPRITNATMGAIEAMIRPPAPVIPPILGLLAGPQ